MKILPKGKYPIKQISCTKNYRYFIVLNNGLCLMTETIRKIADPQKNKKFIYINNSGRFPALIKINRLKFPCIKYSILLYKGDFMEELIG